MELNSIKTKINKYAKDKDISVQNAWDNFFYDELLYRISQSEYKDSFVFKGGFYLQKVLGAKIRSTMDIDFKYLGVLPSKEGLKQELMRYVKLMKLRVISYLPVSE